MTSPQKEQNTFEKPDPINDLAFLSHLKAGFMNLNEKTIGQIIKDLRKKTNLSQKEFSAKYGIPDRTLSRLENGENVGLYVLYDTIKAILSELSPTFEEISKKE